MRAAFTRQPVISDVEMAAVAKRMLTVVYVPVIRGDVVDHVIAAAIEPPNWKGVLRAKLPLQVEAVLLDRHAFVVTSTLDGTETGAPRSALNAAALKSCSSGKSVIPFLDDPA